MTANSKSAVQAVQDPVDQERVDQNLVLADRAAVDSAAERLVQAGLVRAEKAEVNSAVKATKESESFLAVKVLLAAMTQMNHQEDLIQKGPILESLVQKTHVEKTLPGNVINNSTCY